MDLSKMITIEHHDSLSGELERYLKLIKPEVTTVYELQYMLFFTTGLHPRMQRLFFECEKRGTVLLEDPAKLLSVYGVDVGDKVHLMEKISPEFQEIQNRLAGNGGGGGTGRHSARHNDDFDEIYAGIEVEVPPEPEVFLQRLREDREMDEAVKKARSDADAAGAAAASDDIDVEKQKEEEIDK